MKYNFSYRPKDVGRPKAEVAAEFLNDRVPNCTVVPYPFHTKKNYLILWSFCEFFCTMKDICNTENTDKQEEYQ